MTSTSTSSSKVKELARAVKAKNPVLMAALTVHRNHRGRKLDLERFPSMKALYAETRPKGAVIKSVQGGVSEWLLVKGITEAGYGRNVFWVLPSYGLVSRFVKERFDKTMSNTPQYQGLVSEKTQSRFAATMTLKQFGAGTIAFVGSFSVGGFTEFVADTLIIDELDQCELKNIAMAPDRLGMAESPEDWRISNPTITGYGIDEVYGDSTQGRWHMRCECGKYVHPDPFEVLLRQVDDNEYVVRDPDYEMEGVMEPRMFCPHCNRELYRFGEGVWVESYPRRQVAGYHFSKLFTSNSSLRSVIDDFDKGLTNSTRMMRCYNANFGLAFDAPGAKITRKMLDDATAEYRMQVPSARCILGADVGAVINAVVGRLVQGELGWTVQVVWAGLLHHEQDVLDLYDKYNCLAGVIDAMPEERMTRRLVRRRGGLFRAYYDRGKNDRLNKQTKVVTLSRTAALDAVKEGLQLGTLQLPADIATVEGFYDQMMASTRVYDEDRQEYVWREGSRPDHYHHAMAYMQATRALVISAM